MQGERCAQVTWPQPQRMGESLPGLHRIITFGEDVTEVEHLCGTVIRCHPRGAQIQFRRLVERAALAQDAGERVERRTELRGRRLAREAGAQGRFREVGAAFVALQEGEIALSARVSRL